MQSRIIIIESPVEMESSSSSEDQFYDALEFLPEETSCNSVVSESNSSPADAQSPTGKRTKERKGGARETVKRCIRTLITKVCPGVKQPNAKEPTAGADPLESTERDSKGRKSRAWKAVRRGIQTLISLMKPTAATDPLEPEIAQPSTSAFVSPLNIHCQESEYLSNHGFITGDKLSLTVEDFHRLYKVEEELEYYHGAYEGTRKIDGQKMTIRFIERRQRGEKSASAKVTKPLYEEMAAVLILQKHPTCQQIIRLYDCFTMSGLDVLVMEHPHPYITLGKFLNIKNQHLDEQKAKHIMLQLFSVLNHCWDRGVFFPIDVERILINPDTLQIKIMDFRCAQLIVKRSDEAKVEEWLREQAKLQHSVNLYRVMEALVRNVRCPFWKRRRLSKECVNLLEQLKINRGMRLLKTLENISDDPWFVGRRK